MAAPDLHWLCDLVDSSLSGYIDAGLASLTKEEERDLLVALSQISRRICRAIDEPPPHCRRMIATEAICGDGGAGSSKLHSSACHGCLINITARAAASLMFESQFVRHSARKIFVALSGFLLKHEDQWKKFMHLLCLSLEAAVFNAYVPILSLSAAGPNLFLKDDCVAGVSMSFFRLRLVNAKWFTVAELLQILRDIFKHLDDNSGMHVTFYMNAVIVSLSFAISSTLGGLWACKSSEAYSSSSGQIFISANPERRDVILGVLLQLLCSLSKRCGPYKASEEEHLIASQIIDLVPKFFSCGLLKDRSSAVDCMSQFLKHKVMMLMIRLSDCIHQERTTLALWLQLLRNGFEDVLCYPLCETTFTCYSYFEGSPFLATMVDGNILDNLRNRHLQRQAVFLLFKCTFNAINMDKETCVDGRHCKEFEGGIFELSNWLEMHVPAGMFIDQEIYLEECRRFAFSFLKCFLDEDDFLFEMLLLLLDYSHLLETVDYEDHGKFCEEMKGNILFHFASIFNPVHLFHLFLAGIQYDHSMLLDWLISKGTGILCVRYLLKCLRIVARSWDLFVKFVIPEFDISLSACKKRKVCLPDDDSLASARPSTSCSTDYVKRPESGSAMIVRISGNITFENASKCLLCLKRSVESLHKKSLFPYNPTVLLRSFIRFEELCKNQFG